MSALCTQHLSVTLLLLHFLVALEALASPTALHPTPLYLTISNALSTYCYLLDTKNFTGLSAVFVDDVLATFPEPLGVMHGVDALAAGLNQSLLGVQSQHLLGSISIDVYKDAKAAESRS